MQNDDFFSSGLPGIKSASPDVCNVCNACNVCNVCNVCTVCNVRNVT